VGVYIYKSESIAIRNGNISEYGSEHRNAMSEHGIGTGTRIGQELETGTKLETVILRVVLVIPEFKHGTKFRESWSQCEAVIAVLQGLMSSEVELVEGV